MRTVMAMKATAKASRAVGDTGEITAGGAAVCHIYFEPPLPGGAWRVRGPGSGDGADDRDIVQDDFAGVDGRHVDLEGGLGGVGAEDDVGGMGSGGEAGGG